MVRVQSELYFNYALLRNGTDALATYQAATGAVPDDATGLLRLTPAQFANLESLFFNIGGVSNSFHRAYYVRLLTKGFTSDRV